jgi:diguanylate cyclase (GGDEF)-like protein
MSIIGLSIQCAGIILITILSFFMTRSIRRRSLDYWTLAWTCLSISLLSLAFGFHVAGFENLLYSIYILGECAFGLLFIAGCRSYATDWRLSRGHLLLLIPGIAIAFILPRLSDDFDLVFIPQATIMAALFATALYVLRHSSQHRSESPGLKVMRVALVLLALDFLHYVPLLAYAEFAGIDDLPYLRYSSIYDLILEILLGFGTVMLVMDDVRYETEVANRELTAARDKLEILVRLDPMTEALNRHAFYSLVENQRDSQIDSASGCVVVIDIDNLKPINDSFGHTVGDAAIREVATSLRSVIRADDLLFRWGGDEFLVLMFNISPEDASRRVYELEVSLARTQLPHSSGPVPLIVSYGVASFRSMGDVERSIDEADAAMYAHKQGRRGDEKFSEMQTGNP